MAVLKYNSIDNVLKAYQIYCHWRLFICSVRIRPHVSTCNTVLVKSLSRLVVLSRCSLNCKAHITNNSWLVVIWKKYKSNILYVTNIYCVIYDSVQNDRYIIILINFKVITDVFDKSRNLL